MDSKKLSQRWFLAAITYLVIGLGFGVYMGASGNHSLFTVHSHISLLGWVSMGLTGLLYQAFPTAAKTRLAAWHFWLYQLAAPVMLLAVGAIYLGAKGLDPIAGVASVVLLVSVLLFWWAIFSARNDRTTGGVQ
jgi:hypothetical protein